ncbi:Hsp20/alpha crystallin family protein [Spongiivirga sp. MCCC 1A20706]|uniref:Hsp20/alpha crystallin family protein n=1 Tax=Spongiivirga sp. MCCC 1A20706 TaxID=3160963 RepID=UPI0039777DD1
MSLVKRKNDIWFPSLLEDVFGNDFMGGVTLKPFKNSSPAVNIKEDNTAFILEVAAPGLKKEDFNIDLDNDVLTIASNTKEETKNVHDGYTRFEFNYSEFKRSFTIPETVNVESINAGYEDGILKITLPKKEEATVPSKRAIEIA